VLTKLKEKQIGIEEVTLHVGAGTFTPVKSETIDEHEMHTEHFVVRKENLENLLNSEKVVAIGTTSVRTIESIYWLGVKLLTNSDFKPHISQWEVYKLKDGISKKDALTALLKYMNESSITVLHASTQIMIFPGYKFKIVDLLITKLSSTKQYFVVINCCLYW
jgi:S-adenosylmethionine:tRNA ribosyltransferase-isomerase